MAITVPDAVEIVPRLWTGKYNSCDWCRRNLNFTCIDVGPKRHTVDSRCNWIWLCNRPDGYVASDQFSKVMNLIFAAFSYQTGLVLLHGPDGLSYAPLVTALYLQKQYALTLPQAYQWVLEKQPQAYDLSRLTPPRDG